MDNDRAAIIESVLDETVGGWKELQEVFVILVVNVDLQMFVGANEVLIDWPTQDGDNVGDVGLLDGVSAAQGKEAGCRAVSCLELRASRVDVETYPPMKRLPAAGTLSSQPMGVDEAMKLTSLSRMRKGCNGQARGCRG